MRVTVDGLHYFFLLIIAFSISLQFDYVFFNNYFFMPFLVVVSAFIFSLFFNIKEYVSLFFLVVFLAMVLLFVLVVGESEATEVRRAIVYPAYIIISVYTVNNLLQKIERARVEKLIRLTIMFCLLAVVVETYFRFTMPVLDLRFDNGDRVLSMVVEKLSFWEALKNRTFYAYKYSSIMFFDSNYVGLFLLPLMILNLFYLENIEVDRRCLVSLLVVLGLIFLTFSRSAIITAVAVLCLFFLYKAYKKSKSVVIFLLALLLIFSVYVSSYVFGLLMEDGSFVTKIGIFYSLAGNTETDIVGFLFGFGVVEGGYKYSYTEGAYAHAFIPLFIGQYGLIGLLLYFSFWVYFSSKVGFFGWLLFFSFLLSGLSLADPWQILNYFAMLLMLRYIRVSEHGEL